MRYGRVINPPPPLSSLYYFLVFCFSSHLELTGLICGSLFRVSIYVNFFCLLYYFHMFIFIYNFFCFFLNVSPFYFTSLFAITFYNLNNLYMYFSFLLPINLLLSYFFPYLIILIPFTFSLPHTFLFFLSTSNEFIFLPLIHLYTFPSTDTHIYIYFFLHSVVSDSFSVSSLLSLFSSSLIPSSLTSPPLRDTHTHPPSLLFIQPERINDAVAS